MSRETFSLKHTLKAFDILKASKKVYKVRFFDM